MKDARKEHASKAGGHYSGNDKPRRAVGYIRVSTDMQAADGLSLEPQHAAIQSYCTVHGIKLVRICKDVLSGGKDQRAGLQDDLDSLQRSGEVIFSELCARLRYGGSIAGLPGVCARREGREAHLDPMILHVQDFAVLPFPRLNGLPLARSFCPDAKQRPRVPPTRE